MIESMLIEQGKSESYKTSSKIQIRRRNMRYLIVKSLIKLILILNDGTFMNVFNMARYENS